MTTQTHPTTLPTGTWQLDGSATTITVSARKLGLFTIPAELTVTSGMIEIDANHEVVNVEILADAASYRSKNSKRNEHVLSDDFLDADKHPTIAFRTGGVTATEDGYRAEGTITVKGEATPIDVLVSDIDVTEAQATFLATANIDRKAVGVTKFPAFFIGRNLQLTASASARRT